MNQQKVIARYKANAEEYAANLLDEPSKKPLGGLFPIQPGIVSV
jgi:hypothetical protein